MLAITVLAPLLPTSHTLAMLSVPALLPLAVLIAAAALARGRRPDSRRILVAVCLTLAILTTTYASDGEVIIMDNCRGLSPDDAMYWVLGCYLRPWWPF